MNLKVANLIAIELAVLIAIMAWLAYSRVPSADPRTGTQREEEPAAGNAPAIEPQTRRSSAVDYGAVRAQALPMNEQPAATTLSYDQQIAPQPDVSSAVDNGAVAETAPSYAEPDQEPAVVQPDYLASPQVFFYPQPVVVFYNSRRFSNRFRSMRAPGTFMTGAHWHPGRVGPGQHMWAAGSRHSTGAAPGQPSQGSRPRANR
jgi:hypothetical protein